MPIKGLSDRGLSFPEIGQLRKGRKESRKRRDGSSYEVPVDLTYFRATFDEQEAEAAETFQRKYGDEPTEINILLPFDEIERMWDPYLEAYTAGRMIARSDGEYYTYLVDSKSGEILIKNGADKDGKRRLFSKDQPAGYDYQDKPVYCKPVGRFRVIIPELARAAYVVVLTGSVHDIANISQQLRGFKVLNGGRLAGIPLVLRRRPKKISVPKPDGSKVRMEKWMLSVEADPKWVRAKLAEVHRLALPAESLQFLEEPEAEVELPPELAGFADDEEMEPPDDEGSFTGPELEPELETDPEPEPETETNQPIENPDPMTEEAWKEWKALEKRAKKAGLETPTITIERVTKSEMRELYKTLLDRVKIVEKQPAVAE